MKKLLLLALSITGLVANAQNFYNFSVSQQTYTDLTGATSINNGQVWDWDDFNEVEIPFDFKVYGNTVDRFMFSDDLFFLLGEGADFYGDDEEEGIYAIGVSSTWIQDRTYSTGVSSSPISYKVEGETGSRILKLEVKNAGLEIAEEEGFDEDTFYVSYQVWLYEEDNTIEYHYGSNNFNTDDILVEDDFMTGFGSENVSLVYGSSTNPSYGEYTFENYPEDGLYLDAFPGQGTVYKFTPNPTAGVSKAVLAKVAVYPNPAATMLTINTGKAYVTDYVITDVTGKVVSKNTMPATNKFNVNVEGLTAGMYFVSVNGQQVKFIKS